MRPSIFLSLAAAVGAYALPTVTERAPESEFDVLIAPDANVEAVLNKIERKTDEKLKHTYSNAMFNGFSGTFSAKEVAKLRTIPGVSSVDPVVEVSIAATRDNAPWGLQRISQTETVSGADPEATTFTYSFNDESLGQGVDIYIIDTGIRTTHEQFGGRAKMGFTSTGVNTDDNGHGTHVSGTSAGNTVGVASKANLIGVKVLSGSGSGTSADFIKGMDFVVNQHNQRKAQGDFVASVASMSLGFQSRSQSVEKALLAMSGAGVHSSVASGNSATNTCNSTPGSLGGTNSDIVSVGAADINDQVADFSNSGPCTDVYAPGVAVVSSFNEGDDAFEVLDGTSMATPHVSGLMAFLAAGQPGISTAAMKQLIVSSATKGKLTAGNADVIPGGQLIIANNGASNSSRSAIRRSPYTGAHLAF